MEQNVQCNIHQKRIVTICTSIQCINRLLCGKCYQVHDQSHSNSFVPYEDIFDNEGKVIFFDEVKRSLPNQTCDQGSFLQEMEKIFVVFKKKIMEHFEKLDIAQVQLKDAVLVKLNDLEMNYENEKSIDTICEAYRKVHTDILRSFHSSMTLSDSLQQTMQVRLEQVLDSFCDSIKLSETISGWKMTKGKRLRLKGISDKLLVRTSRQTQGRVMINDTDNQVYFYDGFITKELTVYKSFTDFTENKIHRTCKLSSQISGTYPVIHNGFLIFIKYDDISNQLIKYDLSTNKEIAQQIIEEALTGNKHNSWGGYNDIQLFTDSNRLYAVYATNFNEKKLTVALIDENNLKILKIWNIEESTEKKSCGPIFIIDSFLYYCMFGYHTPGTKFFCYDLINESSTELNINFENAGNYDSSLTYYGKLNCLMTVNNKQIFRYSLDFEEISQ